MFFFCSVGYNSQSTYHRRLVMTRSGRKIKGRGPRVGAQRLNRPMLFSSFNRLLIAFADWAFFLNIEFLVLIIHVFHLYQISNTEIPNPFSLEVQRSFPPQWNSSTLASRDAASEDESSHWRTLDQRRQVRCLTNLFMTDRNQYCIKMQIVGKKMFLADIIFLTDISDV